jgi:hypothetical protein
MSFTVRSIAEALAHLGQPGERVTAPEVADLATARWAEEEPNPSCREARERVLACLRARPDVVVQVPGGES